MALLVNAVRKTITCVYQHLEAVRLEESINLILCVALGLVIELLLVFGARPKKVHNSLTVSNLDRPDYVLYLR